MSLKNPRACIERMLDADLAFRVERDERGGYVVIRDLPDTVFGGPIYATFPWYDSLGYSTQKKEAKRFTLATIEPLITNRRRMVNGGISRKGLRVDLRDDHHRPLILRPTYERMNDWRRP